MKKTKLITITAIFLFLFLAAKTVYAQSAISLSITPPLFELMIQPGKEVKQVYNLMNNGGDAVVIPKIVYFTPTDEFGNVDITEDVAPDWVKYSKDPISLKNGGKTDFNVIFSPPEGTEEIDHFLTLIFETSAPTDILAQNSTFYKSQIGTNILITVSKDGNPKKSAEILKFSAPQLIDSLFGKINYEILIKNNGNSFWKPNGKIITSNGILKIAPQNILSGFTRKIRCVDNENLIDCGLQNKFNIGKIVSKIEFTLDDDPKIYKNEVVTYAFPFSVLILLFLILTLFRLRGILNVWGKRR